MPNGCGQAGSIVRISGLTHRSLIPVADLNEYGKAGPDEWNTDHVFTGGSHGQSLIRDTTTSSGVSWGTGATGFIGAAAYNSTTQSISNNTTTVVTFDSEDWDTDGFHSILSNTGRMTIPAGLGGKYIIIASGRFGSSTNQVEMWFRKNGTTNLPAETGQSVIANSVNGMHNITIVDLAAGDYVETLVWQSSGGSLNFGFASTSREAAAYFSIVKLDSGGLGQGVGAKAYNSSTQNLTASTADQPLTLDSEEYDTDGFHSTGSNTSRLTVPAGMAGKYFLDAGTFHVNGTVSSLFYFLKNGVTPLRGGVNIGPTNSVSTRVQCNAIVELAVGDYIEFVCTTGAGSSQTAGHASSVNAQTWVALTRLDSSVNRPTYPTIIQTADNENSSASSIVLTFGTTPVAGNRIILGASSLGRDANSVTQTNVTWTKMGVANSSTSIYSGVWVGVVGASAGTTITISYTGNNFNQGVAIEVSDILTPTQAASGTSSGTNLLQSNPATLTLAQSVAGRFWVAFAASNNGTVQNGLWVSNPSHVARSPSNPLHIGYCVPGGILSAQMFMGTTSSAYAIYLCTIT